MNPDLIPAPDVLGLPAPAPLLLALMALTLAIHWLFIGAAVGSTGMVLLCSLRRSQAAAGAAGALLTFLPFLLSMGVTMGIAPLLFVQVMYGNFFYSANVLLAWPWLGIVPLVIANLYLFYVARSRLKAGKGLGPGLPGVMLVVFVMLAGVLAANGTLTQCPWAWQAFWARKGMSLFTGDMMGVRLTFALTGFLTFGAYLAAVLARAGLLRGVEDSHSLARRCLTLAIAASIGQILAGALVLRAVPAEHHIDIAGGGWVSIFTFAGGAAVVLMPVLLLVARRKGRWPLLILPGVAAFVGAIGIAVARDLLRQAYLAQYFSLAAVPVNPQWGAFAFFALFLVLGLAAVVVLLKLATSKSLSR